MAAYGQHDIMAEKDYDPTEAKFCACLFWLIFHATEDGEFGEIPSEITCPTERDPEERFLVRSNVVKFLCKGTVYVKVCSQVFQSEEIKSTWGVIQKLSKEGLYVIDTNDEAVTEERLSQSDEFDLDAHLAMMDTLMMAHVNKSVEIQQIVSAISSFASFNAAKELPFDLEDALLLWLNKVSATNEKRLRKARSPDASSAASSGRFRFRREQILARSPTLFPKLDDLQIDVANGKALLSLLLFYFPETLSHENIKTSDPMNQSDVICNIELFRELCAQHVCTSVFALRTEDFVYKAPELKNNLLALLAEIFVIVELEKSALGIVDNRDAIELNGYVRDIELDKGGKVLDEYRSEVEASTKENFDPNGLSGDIHSPRIEENKSDEKETYLGGSSLSSYERLKNFELVGSAEKQRTIDDVDDVEQSIQDKLQKLKTLSSMKKESVDRETVPTDSERSYFGIEKGQWNQDSAAKADFLHKTGSVVKSRQPLLSKRSKKQLKNLEKEERSFSQEDLSGVHLVDFDLKRSHSLTSVVGKSNYSVDPSKSFKAWGEEKCNEDLTKSKGQKISLDFKPDTTSFRRQTPISSTEQLEAKPVKPKLAYQQASDSDLAYWQAQNDFAGKRYGQSYYVDDTPKRLIKPLYDQSNNSCASHESTSSEDLKNFRTEILERTRKVDSKEEHASDFDEPQFEDDDLFASGQFVSNIPSISTSGALGHGQSPRPNKLLGLDAKQNVIQQHPFRNEHVKDHDDDLSTIAETSEPSTPTVYSFQTDRSEDDSENSRTLGTDDDTRESYDDCQSPTVVSQDITPFNSMDDTELPKTIPNSASEFQFALRNKQSADSGDDASQWNGSDGHLLKRPSITPGLSYTVLSADMSLEAAKAAGLPIIGNSGVYNEIDVNSFDSAVLDAKLGGNLKSEREMNAFELGQRNKQFVAADLGDDGTSVQKAEDPALSHCNSTSDFDDIVKGGDVFDSQEANKRLVLQDTAPGDPLKEAASSQNVAMDFGNRKYMQDRSQRNLHHELQQLDQSDDINEEALRSQPLKSENEAAGGVLDTLEDITRSFQQTSDSRNPPDLEFKPEGRHLAAGKESNTKAFREEEPFDVNRVSAIDDRDANSTITWSDIQAEKKSSRRNLKSPEKEKGRAVTTVGDCPVINWAEYAKNREPVDDTHENEDDSNTPRGFLAPRLAVLKMQLEEKRRHIEEEKRRRKEQWTEERAKIGQQAFWLAVSKDTKEDIERMEKEKEAAMLAERKKKPGLRFIPFSDENDPAKVLKRPPKKRNMNDLSPHERLAPAATSSATTKQRDDRTLSTEAEYLVHHNRIGSKTIMETERSDKETFVIAKQRPSSEVSNSEFSSQDQVSDNVFVNDPELVEDSFYSSRNKTRTVPKPFNGHEFAEEDKRHEEASRYYARDGELSIRNAGDNTAADKRHRTAWAEPHIICPADFPIVENSQASAAIENDNTVPYVEPHSYRHPAKTQAIASGFTEDKGTPEPLHEFMNSSRRQGEDIKPGLTELESGVFKSPRQQHVGENMDSPRARGVAAIDHTVPPQGENLVNIGEELEIGQTTLTPEQQKKKEKFIQNRIRKQQEEKAKREAELEKRRKKEEKIKERKAAVEKRERDEQERIRRQRQEDELTRRKEEEDSERRIPPRLAKKEEQWTAVSSKKHGSGSGSSLFNQDDGSPANFQSAFSEYKGPPVYVKPTGKSNRQIMINAISYCCLSGEVNREAKEKSLQVLGQSNATHFFVLFRDGLKFRGLFTYSQENDEAHKIYGLGPKVIVNKMVERLFKYSSGAKSFSQIPAKSLSIQVDGIQIKKEFWQSTKTQPPSKTDSNLRKGSGGSTSRVENLKKGSPKLSKR